jgi:NADH-quinone oxidoreductase subunit N
MNFSELVNLLVAETTQKSLRLFAPELALCVTIVVLLLARMILGKRLVPAGWVALIGTVVGLVFAGLQFMQIHGPSAASDSSMTRLLLAVAEFFFGDAGAQSSTFFTGLLVYDKLTVFFRFFLLLFLVLVTVLTMLSGIPDEEDGPDFYTLLQGATIGIMLMASANHLLMLFFGVEMASVPSYAMVGFLKGRRKSSEASLKFVVYGAGAAGVMLYGISLLAGLLGTGELPAIAAQLPVVFGAQGGADNPAAMGMGDAEVRTLMLAIMLVLVGLAFKLSVVPFQFWCPDAFEGAPAEVGGFLSVASKAGAFALLVRFVLTFAGLEGPTIQAIPLTLGIGLGIIAIATATFGNLAAYAQANVKRLLAYSTIAHAGYMLMAVSAMMVILSPAGGVDAASKADAAKSLEGLLYYLCVYFFMNLGAFAIVALIRNQIFSEEISDYRGLAQDAPVLCICMGICMFSLVGIPPFGGFVGKLMIFNSLVVAADVHWFMWVVLVFGGLNTVFSLFYYVRVLKAMFIEPRPEGARIARVPWGSPTAWYTLVVSVPALLLGVAVGWLSNVAYGVATVLFP